METAELSRKSDREPVVSIQIPEVEKLCVEGGIDLPCKKWLLLGGLERKADKGAPPVLVVMLRAEKIIPHLEAERLGRDERSDIGAGTSAVNRESGKPQKAIGDRGGAAFYD